MSSPFAATIGDLHGITDLLGTIPVREHPGQGKTADRADDLSEASVSTQSRAAAWATAQADTAQVQSDADSKLTDAPSPADVEEARELALVVIMNGGNDNHPDVQRYREMNEQRDKAKAAHTAETVTDWEAPDFTSTCAPVSDTPINTDELGGAADGTDETEPAEQGGETPGTPDEMRTPGASPTPKSAVDVMREAPLSDTSVGTETSSSTATADPAARSSLSGQGQAGTPQTGTASAGQPSQMGTGVPASQQLSQGAGQGSSGTRTNRTKSRSPEAQREEQDKREDREALRDAALGTTAGLAGGVIGAASTAPGPNTSPSSSGTAPTAPTAPSTPNTTPPAGAPGAVGGLAGKPVMGGGNTVPPMKKPTEAEADRVLNELIGKPEDKDKKP